MIVAHGLYHDQLVIALLCSNTMSELISRRGVPPDSHGVYRGGKWSTPCVKSAFGQSPPSSSPDIGSAMAKHAACGILASIN